jgi:hypothetical protein
MKYQLFTQVTLAQEMHELGLSKGSMGTIVEYYPPSDGQEAGYSLEGLVVGDTVEVAESQIEAIGISLHEVRQAG